LPRRGPPSGLPPGAIPLDRRRLETRRSRGTLLWTLWVAEGADTPRGGWAGGRRRLRATARASSPRGEGHSVRKQPPVDTPTDWNASAYHRVSAPQTAWGREVLDRLELRGDETVLDAGCGTGKLTSLLAERLPQGSVIALDASTDMLGVAGGELAPFASRV